MLKWTCPTAVLALCFAAAAEADAAPKAGKKGLKRDPQAIFKRLDADGDGKLTKEEFAKVGQLRPNGDGDKAAKFAEKGFERLDADGDGKLTAEEFKKVAEMRRKKD